MPAKKKTKQKGQNITQTVKVVIGEGAKRKKRAYKRRPRKARLDRGSIGAAPLTGPNTITSGESIPIPPRIIEVPTYYKVSEGTTTSTGNQPISTGPSQPAITAGPSLPAIMDDSSKKQKPLNVPAIMDLGQTIKAVNEYNTKEEIKAERERIQNVIESGQLRPSSTFYRRYERPRASSGGVGGTWEQTNPLLDKGRIRQDTIMASQPIIEEPLSAPPPQGKVSETFSITEVYPEKPAKQEKLIVEMGREPSVEDFIPAEKPKSLLQTVLSGTVGAAKSIAAAASDTALGVPPGTTAAVAKKIIPKRPAWNVSDSLLRTYIRKFKVSPEVANQRLIALRTAYPQVTSDEVKKAIRSAPSEMDILL